MFDVTPAARTRVAAFLSGRSNATVRIYVSGQEGERRFSMALDRVRATDAIYEIEGATYLINRDLLAKAQPLRIDCGANGFEISSPLDPRSLKCAGCKASGQCGR